MAADVFSGASVWMPRNKRNPFGTVVNCRKIDVVFCPERKRSAVAASIAVIKQFIELRFA